MLSPSFSCADVTFPQGFLSCFQCLTPSIMRSVFPGDNRDEVACRATEDTLPERSLYQGRVCYDIVKKR